MQGEEESELWKDVTHELMSDEEDVDDKLKVKSFYVANELLDTIN